MGEIIRYREGGGDIIRQIEIDLTRVTEQSKRVLEKGFQWWKDNVDKKYQNIFVKDKSQNKLVYKTEVLIPQITKRQHNLLLVVGNPAVHSVAERLPFSYEGAEGKRREHRFWRALRECEILRFHENMEEPTLENNEYKRKHLLNGEYESFFNIFILPYFSFPTPAFRECNGVAGIRKIVGDEIFSEMKNFEFQRFRDIVLGHDVNNVVCFQKGDAGKEIRQNAAGEQISGREIGSVYPVYKLGGALKQVTLWTAPPTRLLHTTKGKKILRDVVADIKANNKIGG